MKKEVLHKFAEDMNGGIIHIGTAISGSSYFCPGCKEKFVFRKGQIRQQHFSHHNPSTTCTAEGYLHKTFKKMLVERIKTHLASNSPMQIEWLCGLCKQGHNYNLLAGIADVKEEHHMGPVRPDIALISKDNRTPIVIEIIHTHAPEENTLKHYRDNRIFLVGIKLETLEDLENFDKKVKYPTGIAYYARENCPNYRPARQVRLTPAIDIDGIKRRVMAERSRRRF